MVLRRPLGKNNIAIVCGLFHQKHVQVMLDEAMVAAKEANLNIVKKVWVPGSFEKQLVIKRLLSSKEIDGVVALGIIERGETRHGLVIGIAVLSAIINLQLEFNKPVGIGILGPEILPHQIEPRLMPHARNAVLAVKALLKSL